jgi:hypothetical protein
MPADVAIPFAMNGQSVPALSYNTAAGQSLAIGTASVASAVINASAVTLTATSDCWISVGTAPVAAADTAGCDFLPAGVKWTITLPDPTQKVAVIQNSGAGQLVVLPAARG